MNKAVKVANKDIKKIVEKWAKTYKDWYMKLPFAIHAYHAPVQTFMGGTLFSLVYSMEAILSIEVEIPLGLSQHDLDTNPDQLNIKWWMY